MFALFADSSCLLNLMSLKRIQRTGRGGLGGGGVFGVGGGTEFHQVDVVLSLRSLFLLTEHSSEVSAVSTLDSYCERITGVQQAGNGP